MTSDRYLVSRVTWDHHLVEWMWALASALRMNPTQAVESAPTALVEFGGQHCVSRAPE